MNFIDYVNIAERDIELINPTTPEKIIKLGKILGLKEGQRILDFGCGYAEPLILWKDNFGIEGIGIDFRENVCDRARKKIRDRGYEDSLEIVCMNGAEYKYEERSFDVAACIGATFIWGNFRDAIKAMKKAIKPGGRLAIGEVYLRNCDIPVEYLRLQPDFMSEFELMTMAREEGFDFEYVIRSSQEDWDNYEAANWLGVSRWVDEHQDDPLVPELLLKMREEQDLYTRYGREHLGWAMYVLKPMRG